MLKPMPIGNPIISNDKKLENYFGYCYVKITPPTNLKNYLIPYRYKDGSVSCPSLPFKGIYFSELLKESIKYGYKIECLGGIKFNKGYNIFNNFVNTLFNKRMEAKLNNNLTLDKVYKLILNSLYGRLGMKKIENRTVIVNKDKGNDLLNKKNILLVSEFHDKLLIKYNENINKDLLNLLESNNDQLFNTTNINTKQRGIPSAIQIAAAISAYSQLEMMKFKNLDNNKLLYHDTDSLLMKKELNEKYINPNKLGYLKLEHIIKEGYFISPKFYAFIETNNELIKKTKGIDKDLISLDDFKDLSNGISKSFIVTILKKRFKKW
jgi:DNA polymerase type B, organellar and viral